MIKTRLDPDKEYLVQIEDFPRYYISSFGIAYRMKDSKLIRIKKKVNVDTGYVSVNLSNEEGQSTLTLHRLVAKHFLYNDDPENKLVVDHGDCNKENNSIGNLEWVTQSENIRRSWEDTRHSQSDKNQ